MLYLKETFSEDGGVTIHIEGRLDNDSIASLRNLCAGHLSHKKEIQLNLDKVNWIDRESLDYLRSIQKNVRFSGLNSYLQLELDETE